MPFICRQLGLLCVNMIGITVVLSSAVLKAFFSFCLIDWLSNIPVSISSILDPDMILAKWGISRLETVDESNKEYLVSNEWRKTNLSFWCKAFKEVNVSSRVISSIPTFKSTSAYMNDVYWITLGNHVDSYLYEWHVTKHLLIRLVKKIRYCQIIV